MTDPADLANDIAAEVSTVLVGMDDQVERLTIALLTRGHILLEGVPGVAKTTLANTFARASGLTYNRVQMTPDVLPADITGTSVYREEIGEFELRTGPVFANVVVADEINRATPKTQSALLEAMAERHVTIDGETLDLPDPFLVVATQNPIEMEGTFELPEAQRDRFQQKLTITLPNTDNERELLERFNNAPTMGPEDVTAVVSQADIQAARDVVTQVHIEDVVQDYILEIVAATRDHADVAHGASPRGSLALLQTAKARAAIRGRDYVISDDVKQMIEPVLRHRLVLTTDADLSDVSAADIIDDLRTSVTPPEGKVTDANLLTEKPGESGREDSN
ncbi:AAA family ATPase [Haloarcula nitratireducens]|uniref:MoxR family ATPase n=1 Tax=Haloarcula nitratireducens TaxID=2487749 RepID=A0AAW4PID9_9EURY|nr:MoxR family ATPase [Halomicroarcula nitratireducens]MBX0297795.1 MoxR family ATPase [Halomicroarcula nitratireducens]